MCCNWWMASAPVLHHLLHSPISGCRGSCASEESGIHCMGHSQWVSDTRFWSQLQQKSTSRCLQLTKVKWRICEHKFDLQHFVLDCTAWWENTPQIHSWVWYKHNQIIKFLRIERRKWPLHSGTLFYLPLHTNNCMLKIWEIYQRSYYSSAKICCLLLSD